MKEMNNLIPEEDIVICNKNTVKNIEKYVNFITLFLKEVSFLTEAYILDYFVEQLWTSLPIKWLEVVKDFDTHDLAIFLNSEEPVKYKKPWPLSLLAFRASSFSLALSRKAVKSPRVIENFLAANFVIQNEISHVDSSYNECDWTTVAEEFDSRSGQHKEIPEFCRRHVKPKKQHEIYRLGKVTNSVMTSFGINHIIDIGSGLGHLSRYLTLCYNFNVDTIEANKCHVSGAVSFDQQAFCSVKKLKKHEVFLENFESLPNHMEESVTLTSSGKCLEKVIHRNSCQDESKKSMKFALLGLHTCGNLAETILKSFVNCEESQVLISVGCCYMKMESSNVNESYPLSQAVKSLSNHKLSYQAKEMACHALEMYIKRLKVLLMLLILYAKRVATLHTIRLLNHSKRQEDAPSLKIHCYRATLEKCILFHYPDYKHLGLRGVKHAELLKFPDYAEKALSRMSIVIPHESFMTSEVQLCLNRWKEVLVFYSLRLIIAPVIETLILLDRLLYLFEEGHPSCLAAIFDPTISPRNHILLSAKHSKNSAF